MSQKLVEKIIKNNKCDSSVFTAKRLLDGKKLIIYGAGEGYFAVKRTILSPYNLAPSLVVDIKFDGIPIFDGFPALDFESFLDNALEYEDAVIVVTVGNKLIFNDICNRLNSRGIKFVLWAPDLYEYSIHHYDESLLTRGLNYFTDQKDDIERAFSLLEDFASKEVFESILTRYLTGVPTVIPNQSFSEQYVPTDVPLSTHLKDYLCCGAYDGDSIKKVCELRGPLNKVIAFEPDLSNYRKLTNYLRKHSEQIAATICAFPSGVYSEDRQFKFSGNNGLSSEISECGSQVINVVSLDSALPGATFSYITIDIEGAEFEAIKGARELISRCQPEMAISVYHAPQDLWRIINLLDSMDCKYRYYLRNYTGFTYETLLYAVKRKEQ